MDDFLEIINSDKHPIVQIFLLLNEMNKISDSTEYKFQLEKQHQLQIENKAKETQNIKHLIECSSLQIKWDAYIFDKAYTELCTNSDTNNSFKCIFQIMCYLATCNEPIEEQLFFKFLNTLLLVYSLVTDKIVSYFFNELLEYYIQHERSSPINSEKMHIINKLFFLLNDSNKYLSNSFFQLLKLALSCSSSEINQQALDLLAIVLLNNKTYIKIDDFNKIIAVIDPFLKTMNIRAIQSLCLISSKRISQPVKDNFTMLASVVANSFLDTDPTLEFTIFKSNDPILAIVKPNFVFHRSNEHEFEKKFNYIPDCIKISHIPLEITTSVHYNKMYELADALEKANSSCLDSFLMSLKKILSSYENNVHWYDMIGFTFILLNRISNLTSLLQFEEIIFHKSIFHPSKTIFNESKLDPKVNFIRNYLIRISATNAPSLLSNLLVSQSEYPLIAIETICRIHQLDIQIDLRIFTTDKCLTALSYLLDSSWELFKQGKYKDAFHSVFGFILSIAMEPVASQYLFEHRSLVHSFLSLLAERFLINSILDVLRAFLITSTYAYPAIVSGLSMIFHKCTGDEEGSELGYEIINTIIYVLSRNPSHAKPFEELVEPIMKFAMFHTTSTLHQVLQIISLENQALVDFKLSAMRFIMLIELIRRVEGNNPSNQTMTVILNLCAKTNTNSDQALFLIRNPSFIPVALAVFGKSERIEVLFDIFSKLCMYSQNNIQAFHISGFTSIIIEYVFGKKSEINFRGYIIELELKPSLISNKVYPLLEKVLSVQADNYVALQLMNFITDPANKTMIKHILKWLTSSLVNNSSIQLQLKSHHPAFEINELPSSAFNKSFSICMWVKVDQLASISSGYPITLAAFRDHNNDTFKLIYFRGKAYYSFDTSREGWETPITCLANIPSGSMTFISFICQRYSIEKSAVGFFANNQMLFCNEVNHMMFDVSSKLIFSIGEDEISNFNIVQIGHFGLSNKLITEENLQQLSCQNSLISLPIFYFSSMKNNIKSESPISFTFPSQTKPIAVSAFVRGAYQDKSSIRYFLGIGNHLTGFVNCFAPSFSSDTEFLMLILGVIKNILTDSNEAQSTFKGFSLIGHLMMQNPSILSYQIYISFFSIFEVIQNEELQIDLFDGIIMNTLVWSKSPSFARIIRHWYLRITQDCRSMFRRKGIFSTLFRQYPKLLSCVQKDEYINAKHDLSNLMIAIGEIMFVGKDLDVVFSILGEEIEKESDLIEQYLMIIEKFSPLFSNSPKKENNLSLLLILLEKKSINIVVSALKAIHAYTFPKCVTSMIAASIQLNRCEIKQEIYSQVIPMVMHYPGFVHFCCFTALSLVDSEKELCSAVIRGVADILISSQIINDNFWYLGAVLLSIQLKDEALDNMSYFLETYATKSKSLTEIISAILLLTGLLHKDPSKLVLQIIEYALDHDSITSKCVAQLGSMCVLFRFADYSIDPVLLSYYEESPFFEKEIVGAFESWTNIINDVLVVEQILSRDLDKFDLRFGVSVESNSNVFQESPIDKLSMMNLDFSGIQILKTLIEYFSHDKGNDRSSSFKFLEAAAPEIYNAQQQLSKYYRKMIIDTADSIRCCIKNAKLQIQAVNNNRITVTTPKQKQISLMAIASYQEYHESAFLSNLTTVPSCQYGFSYIPGFMKFSFCGLFDEYLKKFNSFSIADIGSAEKNIFSFPAIQRIFGEDYSVCLFISSDRLQLLKSSSFTQQISKGDVEFVIERKPNSIEIFLKSHESIFLDFSPISSHEIIEYLQCFDEKIGREPSQTIQMIFGKQKSWSNIESIIIKELFTGKSFHLQGLEPAIQVGETTILAHQLQRFSPDSSINTLNTRLAIEAVDYNQEFEPMNGGKRKPEVILNDKKMYGLGTSINEIDTFSLNSSSILTVTSTMEINIFQFEKATISQSKTPTLPISSISCVLGSSSGFVIIDEKLDLLMLLTEYTIKQYHRKSSLIAFDGMSILSVVDGCEILLANGRETGSSQHHVVYLPRHITTVALSESIGIFAAGTNRGEIIVHSLYRPEFYAFILVPREPVRILITDCFGIIFVDIEDSIVGFTHSGEEIGRIMCAVAHWAKIRTVDAIDYVVFSDGDGNIMAFTPANMNNVKFICSLERQILALSYNAEAAAIVAFTADGCVTFIPFCF